MRCEKKHATWEATPPPALGAKPRLTEATGGGPLREPTPTPQGLYTGPASGKNATLYTPAPRSAKSTRTYDESPSLKYEGHATSGRNWQGREAVSKQRRRRGTASASRPRTRVNVPHPSRPAPTSVTEHKEGNTTRRHAAATPAHGGRTARRRAEAGPNGATARTSEGPCAPSLSGPGRGTKMTVPGSVPQHPGDRPAGP